MKSKEIISDSISSKLLKKKAASKKRQLAGLCIQTFTGLLAVFWLYSWIIAHLISDRATTNHTAPDKILKNRRIADI